MKKILFCMLAMLVVLCLGTPAKAALIDRGSFAYDDGASHTGFVNLIYDNDFDITWVGDGNFAMTTGFDADGRMTWDQAVAWADGLTIGSYTDWRLPSALNQTAPFGPDAGIVSTSEMGHLFYGELGGTAFNPISGSGDPDLGLFPNLQDWLYWSGTEYSAGPVSAWVFYFDVGFQGTYVKGNLIGYGLAVRSGDVAARNYEPVPEPTTILLLGIGLVGLAGGAARRKFKKKEVVKH